MKTPGGAHGRFYLKLSCWSAAALLAAACNLDNPGVEPPRGQLSYPIALALSKDSSEQGPRYLYVANSNFDLRYNAGSVQIYDLDELQRRISEPSGSRVECVNNLEQDGLELLEPGEPSEDGGVDAGAPDAGPEPMLDAGPLDAGLDAGVADAGSDAGALDAAVDAGVLLDGGELDAAADAASASDAGGLDAAVALEAGVVGDAGSAADAAMPAPAVPLEPAPPSGAQHGPSYYGTLRGILCDGRDDPQLDECCFTREEILEDELFLGEVITGSYASGIALSPDGQRMYVPLRGGGRLLYLDVNGAELGCAGEEDDCERGPTRKSDDEVPNGELAPTPTSLVVAPLSDLGVPSDETFIAVTHERGQLSLFVDRGGAPVLEDVFTYSGQGVNSVSLSPPTLFGDELPRLLHVTSSFGNDSGQIARFGVRLEGSDTPDEEGPREILFQSSPLRLNNLSVPFDMRAVAFDPTNPRRLFALVRGTQQSVAFLELDSAAAGSARVIDQVRIGAGPSKLKLVTLGTRQLLLVSTYDARTIDIIDTHTRELVAQVRGLSGPFDMVMDEQRQLLYVADFRASVLRVVDMRGVSDPNLPPPRIVATLGSPRFAEGPN